MDSKIADVTPGSFQLLLSDDLDHYLEIQAGLFPPGEVIQMDLHCHDFNSDVPDELLGRILNVPETWLKTADLIDTLYKNGCDAITITNHNNARSCFEQLQKGIEVLTGAEFSCTVPDFGIGIHVLTYGFDEAQERDLNKLRKNIYAFLEYTHQMDIPTIWAHPLYYYSREGIPPIDFFRKMSVVFERFEVLNGQRNTWQNLMVKEWLDKLTPDRIDEYANRFNLDPNKYCSDPFRKSVSGGSDSHMGIFSGLTGTYLHVPNLDARRGKEPLSSLALEAIKAGRMAPYGSHQNSEKLTIAFLDYVFQIALNHKDPGLLRMLLHKGTYQDKLLALLVSNAFAEIRRHKVTMRFIELFHNCFMGQVPGATRRWFIPQVYKPVFDDASRIAGIRKKGSDNLVEEFDRSIHSISDELKAILYSRLVRKIENLRLEGRLEQVNLPDLIERFEIPSELRIYFDKKQRGEGFRAGSKFMIPDIPEFLDGLSFPFLASSLILAANFASTRVLYNNRTLLNSFSNIINKYRHPRRMLWLTDTYDDNNGVSIVLQAMHAEIKRRNLPIDIMVCSRTIQPDDHLLIISPQAEFSIPFYKQQLIRVPDFMMIHQLFHTGEYDRVICSTEGPMGLAALYLKHAYSVPAYFYIHTDWIMFARTVLQMNPSNLNRFRRLLRAYYNGFDGLFVLNNDQYRWLIGRHMGFNENRVHLTAHWADKIFYRRLATKSQYFELNDNDKVLLYAGRVSGEKGVMELPEIYRRAAKQIPGLKIVVAGSGPAEQELRQALPEATYLGWVDHPELPLIYSAADLLVLPSRFDTFSVVVLESMSCGLPVIAYNTKGPKDIIEHNKNGYVVTSREEMVRSIITYFHDKNTQISFKTAAKKRSKKYTADKIIRQFLIDTSLNID